MHSSRMRAAHSLPYGTGLCPRGVSVQLGLCPSEVSVYGTSVQGISVQGGLCPRGTPPPCGQTDACENITLSQSSFAGGKIGF